MCGTNNLRGHPSCNHLSRIVILLFQSNLLEQIPMRQLLKLIIMFIKSITILIWRDYLSEGVYMVSRNLFELSLQQLVNITLNRCSLYYSTRRMSHKRIRMRRRQWWLWKLCRVDSSMFSIQRSQWNIALYIIEYSNRCYYSMCGKNIMLISKNL